MDEAWTTGAQLGEAVLELLRARQPFTRENLERTYVARRRSSWVEREAREADGSEAYGLSSRGWRGAWRGVALAAVHRAGGCRGERSAGGCATP